MTREEIRDPKEDEMIATDEPEEGKEHPSHMPDMIETDETEESK